MYGSIRVRMGPYGGPGWYVDGAPALACDQFSHFCYIVILVFRKIAFSEFCNFTISQIRSFRILPLQAGKEYKESSAALFQSSAAAAFPQSSECSLPFCPTGSHMDSVSNPAPNACETGRCLEHQPASSQSRHLLRRPLGGKNSPSLVSR